jgi:hypothetical protein
MRQVEQRFAPTWLRSQAKDKENTNGKYSE